MEKEQRKFKTKLKLLKRLVRQTVFENAALCDECVTVSDKLNKVTEERKFLLKKLLHCQTDRPAADLPQLGGSGGGGGCGFSSASRSSPQQHSQQSLRAILSKLTAQEGAAVVKAMDSNRKKQIAKLREKVKKKYAKKKTVKEALEEKQRRRATTATITTATTSTTTSSTTASATT